ncbi:phenylacetate--CoA ligase PaaK [Hwanghaeella sp.]|uniref:phenylacetate--CoA ligase PaaK n=1 Tax=Hwanghaeella sp. TaxID=2605943 RepID=UPI003CCBC316
MTVTQHDPNDLEPIETASRDEITALQIGRMKRSLTRAYQNVPHYKSKFDAHGVHPDDFHTLDDLKKFPFTTKEDLRVTYPYGLFASPMRDIVRLHASSGTTGKPTVVAYTKGDIDVWAQVMARSIRAGGGTPNDIVHVSYGYGLFTGGLGAHYGAERLGATVIPMSGGQTEKQVQLIRDFRPTIIMVTPSYMLALADEMERIGLSPEECSLEVGIFGAEPWTEEMRTTIEERTGMQAVDIYGLSEIVGPGVSMECIESKDGLHIWEDHFYPEIINPDTGEPAEDGELGELVFTTLSKEAQPIIRYRTRDLTRLLPGTARSMRRMEKVTGRTDDMLIIRGVNVFPSQIEELILKDDRLAPHYQLEVHKEGPLDKLTVNVESRKPADEAAATAMSMDLAHHIKSLVGVSAAVQIKPAGAVERSMGKAKRVIDNR